MNEYVIMIKHDWTVIFATIAVIVTVVSVVAFAPYKEALNECEKNLPRDKHCVLAAVPEEKEKQNE